VTVLVRFQEISQLAINPKWPSFYSTEESEDGTQVQILNNSDYLHFYFKAGINHYLADGTL
jgi:hypothetical protein